MSGFYQRSALTLIESHTFPGSETGHNFTGIPQNFSDLLLTMTVQLASGGNTIVRVNADTGTNYLRLFSQATSAAQANGGHVTLDHGLRLYTDAAFPLQAEVIFGHYRGPFEKLANCRYATRDGEALTNLYVGLETMWWKSTQPITSLQIANTGGVNFTAGSVVRLFGIA